MSGLLIPTIAAEADTLTAATSYAAAGWYVLPVKHGSKHPGSVVGNGWQMQSSRDPKQIAAWFAGTDHGIALHVGRSGGLAIDVDDPDRLPEVLGGHLAGGLYEETSPPRTAPYQSSRPDRPGRGHYLFAQPPGRTIGNGLGRLPKGWGEIRGANGVIVVAPTVHSDGGEYRWQRTGHLPVLPAELADLLDDASPGEDAATDEQVKAFMAAHTGSRDAGLLGGLTAALLKRIADGEARHQAAVTVAAGAMKEAALGCYPASTAAGVLWSVFADATIGKPGQSGKSRTAAEAKSEWQGIVAWAVGQALAADPDATRARLKELFGTAPNDAALPSLSLTTLADVTPEKVEWLWPGYVPAGKLVTLDGDPSLGKSTLSMSLASVITTAGQWPDGSRCQHSGDVILMSAEDGLADTIRPRADAAGADVKRIHAVQGVPIDAEGTLRPPTLDDRRALEETIIRTGARLLVIDVVMAYLPADADSHKDQHIRRVLAGLSSMADRTGCTVLLIRHLNKTGGKDPLYRGGGSIGIVGAARAGLLVAADPDDPERRVLASIKSNLGPPPDSLAYRLVEAGDYGCAKVSWEGASGHTAHTLLAEPRGDDADGPVAWLKEFLSGEQQKATDVYTAADAAGYSKDKAKRAKKTLGVTAVKEGKDGPWYWLLPAAASAEPGGETEEPDKGADPPPVSAPLLPCWSG